MRVIDQWNDWNASSQCSTVNILHTHTRIVYDIHTMYDIHVQYIDNSLHNIIDNI